MTPRVLAVCGKGGVGKTTVSAIISSAMSRNSDKRTLVVDADHAGGLGLALGVTAKKSISKVRSDTIREIKRGDRDKKDLAMSIDYLLMEALIERDNLAFLSIGRPEDIGCYCSVNSLLRGAVETLADKFDFVLIDAEAGIEQVNRKVMSAVDYLLLVSDTSSKAVRVAEQISSVALEVSGQEKTGLLVNRIISDDEIDDVKERTTLEVIGWVPEDKTIRRFDAREIPFFELESCPARDAVEKAISEIGVL
jgi:CO dehydrogenase maturation factor